MAIPNSPLPHQKKNTPQIYQTNADKQPSPGHLLKSVSYLFRMILALLMRKPVDQKIAVLSEWERNKGIHMQYKH